MEKLCLVFGGDSVENEISVLTALKVQKELEKYSCDYLMVYLDHFGNFYSGEGLLHKDNYVNKTGFRKGSFVKEKECCFFKYGFRKEKFDYVFLLVHGKGAEDGTLGGFFDTLKIPCLYPGLSNSSLLQNKANFKRVMESLNVSQTRYEVVLHFDFLLNVAQNKKITKLLYPLIVKPCSLGSSVGVSKVSNENELIDSLFNAFKYDDVVIIEEAVENLKEINVALLRKDDELFVSSLERVNDEDRVLSFIDKYDNYELSKSHIIPADIDKKISKRIVYIAKKVYKILDLKSVVRFDFLFDESKGVIYLNEINAIPGSISYYLFENDNMRLIDLIEMLVNQFKVDLVNSKKLITHYEDGFLKNLKGK